MTEYVLDGRYALICAAPEGMQAMLVEADPERFYVPPYVGHRGWIGVRLDRGFDREEIAGILEDAYAEVAPPSLLPENRPARPLPIISVCSVTMPRGCTTISGWRSMAS